MKALVYTGTAIVSYRDEDDREINKKLSILDMEINLGRSVSIKK